MHHPLKRTLIRLTFMVSGALFPAWSCLAAFRLFHRPVHPERKHRHAKSLPSPETFDVMLDGSRLLHVYRWGEASDPTVLLVHGWSTNPESLSHFTHALLARGYSVVSYDALGHGKSSAGIADLADWADSVRAVNTAIGRTVCIIAHSFGGAAVIVASKQGLDTRKLVLIAPIHDILAVVKHFAQKLGIPERTTRCMQRYTWQRHKEAFRRYGKDWHDIVCSNYRVPTLICHDTEDRQVGIEHARALQRKWPWAVLFETKGLGHRRILDAEQVTERVIAFIDAPG